MIKRVGRIFLIIVFVLFATVACTPPRPPSPPSEAPFLPESSTIPKSSSLPELPSEQPLSSVQKSLNTKMENAFSASLIESLSSEFGIIPHFDDILANGNTFRAVLRLDNGADQPFKKEIQGVLSYDPSAVSVDHFVVNWGGICIVDPDTIAIITLDSVTLLDVHSLAEKPFPPDLSVLEENTNAVGVGRIGDEYILAVVTHGEPNEGTSIDAYYESFLLFDQNGALTDTVSIGQTNTFSRYEYSLERELLYAEQIFTPTWENERFAVVPNLATVFSIDSPMLAHGLFASRYDNGDDTLLITDVPEGAGVAFLYKQDTLASAVALPNCHPGIFVRHAWSDADSETAVNWNDDQTVTVSSSYFDTTMVLDFVQNTAAVVFTLNTEHLNHYDEVYPPPESPDGRYRIVESSRWSVTEASQDSNAWLYDTVSDAYQFLDIFTSSYGGYGDRCGFFYSNHFYRMNFPGQLMIYDIIDSTPSLRLLLSDNAFAVTYAADRGYYYVLESDVTGNDTMNVATWDDGGNLIGRHETSIPKTNHLEGYYSPVIAVSGNSMYYESPHLDLDSQNVRIKGVLDLTTFEFVETSREAW
jgi:hypothetical protein